MNRITLTQPDDWHLHLRDNATLASTVPAATRGFGSGIIMPNLLPPATTVAQASAYRERILAQRPAGSSWQPLMVLYLTDNTTCDEIRAAKACGFIHGCKYYPAGATTNSDSGVTDLKNISAVLDTMQEVGMVLQLHGEVTAAEIDIFDREAVFIERHLIWLAEQFPRLKIVLEHITTKQAADYVAAASSYIAATITPQHLLYNRNHMLVGGIRPHLFCLPILKRNIHQQALIAAATSGNPKFFLGTDSAPTRRIKKRVPVAVPVVLATMRLLSYTLRRSMMRALWTSLRPLQVLMALIFTAFRAIPARLRWCENLGNCQPLFRLSIRSSFLSAQDRPSTGK